MKLRCSTALYCLASFAFLTRADVPPLPVDPKAPVADWATVLLLKGDSLPLKDASRAQAPVVSNDCVLTDGRFGQAVDFGEKGAPDVAIPLDAQPENGLTIECWAWLEERGEERLQRIVGRSSMYGFYIAGRAATLTWFVKVNPGRKEDWKSITAPMPLKQWVHLAGTFDGKASRLYINGQLAAESKHPGTLPVGKTPVYFGCGSLRGELRFLGMIDEVRVSKIARTEFMTGIPLERPAPTAEVTPIQASVTAMLRTLTIPKVDDAPTIDGKLNDAVWKRLPAADLRTSDKGSKPNYPTEVKAAYDGQFLYLACRALEKGQETFRAGPEKGAPEKQVFKGDAVEVFLQPRGAGTPYYQLALNPLGAVCDLRWPKGRQIDWDWTCEGLRSVGEVRPDDWSVEVAIPFAALGAETPGTDTTWRANVCRNETPGKELTSWAMTGGGFGIPNRFGVFSFGGAPPEPAEGVSGTAEVSGTILNEDGTTAAGVPIRTAIGLTRTDRFGEFRIGNVAQGELVIQIESPRYRLFTGKVAVAREEEVLEPIRVQRVDPYLPGFSGPVGPGKVAWLTSSIDEPPDMTVKPQADSIATELTMLATRGEYETRAVALFANGAIASPAVRVDSLSGPAVLPSECVDVRWTQRLLKRVQYRRLREDAVYNWRFLWREAPEQIAQGHVRQLVVTVHVPDGTPAGLFQGNLILSAQGKDLASLPVRLRVPGFGLATPEKRAGSYYRGRGKTDDQIRREMADIREHGGSVVIWHASIHYHKEKDGSITYDTDAIRDAVELQRGERIGPPFIIGTHPLTLARMLGIKVAMTPECAAEIAGSVEFRQAYAGALKALADLETEMGAGEFMYAWMDEVFGRGRYEVWEAIARLTREFSDNRIYITFHNRKQEMVDKIAPWVDLRCYHGHTLDSWQAEGHAWQELADELAKDGDEAWNYYNIREIAVTSEWVRLCNGYWLWQSPISAHVPWTYYHFGGSAFDDLDSDTHDFAYAAPHPDKPEMVSTLEWECFREGYDDLRYLATLEQSLTAARKRAPRHKAVAAAGAVLAGCRDAAPQVPAMAEKLSARDYAQRRVEIANAIEALGKIGQN
ncbi:MAG: hypothetical protein HN742_41015 [Lentisphaerae bacterium]|jgi:hypothetical protein|nr:hypothetical protein [Lentisphaerota bacterium]MBT4822871.1 hypothetical protein [Lentisphaerota bacterium]MBT5605127.1 hypothetical protein [Lentisphaerota bacterium]MBT7059861.1 hypothetical protein [Lentisphaerota bacterium]MBT7848318.1 hypothetical protein [Lentisphaerota bacterium]